MDQPCHRAAADVPSFVRDALGGDAETELSLEVLAALGELSGSLAAARRGASRLQRAVERLPLRYAPFFDRLGALWDLSEAELGAQLELAADPARWRRPLLPGIALFELEGGPRTRGAEVKLARFAPGLSFPRHRHAGREAVLVLEGDYVDSAGRHVGPGELHEMLAGSEHGLSIGRSEPCVAALVEHGVEFSGFVLRTLQRWLDR